MKGPKELQAIYRKLPNEAREVVDRLQQQCALMSDYAEDAEAKIDLFLATGQLSQEQGQAANNLILKILGDCGYALLPE